MAHKKAADPVVTAEIATGNVWASRYSPVSRSAPDRFWYGSAAHASLLATTWDRDVTLRSLLWWTEK